MSLLDIRDLIVTYPRGRGKPPLAALRGVTLTIGAGQTLALVGESGSGKSTLGNVITGLTPAASGSVSFDGADITRASPRERRALSKDIQAVFQDPFGSLNPVRTVRQTLTEPLRAHGKPARAEAAARAAAVLAQVGLGADIAARYPGQLSGGQRQRVAIARALVLSPRLIVCDEPTSALDLSVQAQVINLLRSLQRDLGVAYLFITHDLAIVPHIAHRVAVMYQGQIVETGPAGQVCAAPAHAYTRALLSAAPGAPSHTVEST